MVPSDNTVGGKTPETGPSWIVRRNSVAMATGARALGGKRLCLLLTAEVENDSGGTDCWWSRGNCVRKTSGCSSLYRGDSVVSGSRIVEFARTGLRIVEFVRTEVVSTASDCKEGFDSPEYSIILLDF